MLLAATSSVFDGVTCGSGFEVVPSWFFFMKAYSSAGTTCEGALGSDVVDGSGRTGVLSEGGGGVCAAAALLVELQPEEMIVDPSTRANRATRPA